MIVLDTNVVSELMRDRPDPGVVTWADSVPAIELYVTAVTTAELLYGVEQVPPGARRRALAAAVAELIADDFAGRVLSFDVDASLHYADIVGNRNRQGRPIGMADAMIAATARSAGGGLLVTRNLKDFEGTGLDLLDPWVAGES